MKYTKIDVLIIGAGAAGLMCAIEAGKRKRSVLVLDHANKVGKKILMSGGGRCNFTNLVIKPENYISHNPHFAKSALSRFTPQDFIELVNKHRVAFHEKKSGQLFCNEKSKDIVTLLLTECEAASVCIQINTPVLKIEKFNDNDFQVTTALQNYRCESLVIATGGLSIPTLGASKFGYQVAQQFGIPVWPTRAGLVPFTWNEKDKVKYEILSGISVDCTVSSVRQSFTESMLFTHRGLSGPAMLQISSYWELNESIIVNFLPTQNLFELLKKAQKQSSTCSLRKFLLQFFSKKQLAVWLDDVLLEKKLADFSYSMFEWIAAQFQSYAFFPNGTEGYRTAEVTLGGVNCDYISSKTFEATAVKGLYFIGEVLDVTGWLGGFNFQWAWASGYAAGSVV